MEGTFFKLNHRIWARRRQGRLYKTLCFIAFLGNSLLLGADGFTVKGLSCGSTCDTVELSQYSSRLFLTDSTTSTVVSDTDKNNTNNVIKPSFYKTKELDKKGNPVWKERKLLDDLIVGNRLEGYIFQEYLEGVTGPKVYLECGVGRYDRHKHQWKIVHGMLRLGPRNAKLSVTQKRLARLRKKTTIECFVSRIRLKNGQLEVVLDQIDIPKETDEKKMVSVSSLKPGQELVGTVQALKPFGALVDVGANRPGLLHIQKVADLYGSYIDREKGLEEAGLEKGSRIKVQVESNEKKRLFLDFTEQVKKEAEKDRMEPIEGKKRKEERKSRQTGNGQMSTTASQQTAVASGAVASVVAVAAGSTTSSGRQVSKDEEDAWAEYAAEYQTDDTSQNDDESEDEDDDDDYDGYDEDRDIEDALGLGTY